MNPSEKAKWLLDEMKGGCCRCPHDSEYAAILCVDQIIEALKIGKARELVVDDPSKPMEDMKMVGGVEYWERVKIALHLI